MEQDDVDSVLRTTQLATTRVGTGCTGSLRVQTGLEGHRNPFSQLETRSDRSSDSNP